MSTRRRARGEHSVSWDADRRRYVARATVGYDGRGKRIVKKASGTSESAALRKLRKQVQEYEAGLVVGSDRYTVGQAVTEWLEFGQGSIDAATVTKHRTLCETHILPSLGGRKLRDLTALEVEKWLRGLSVRLTSGSLAEVRSCLNRTVKRAQARGMVQRNVVELCEIPRGRAGRRSKSLTFEQARDVLALTKEDPLYPYIVVSLLTGARTEEMRALRWEHVHLDVKPDVVPVTPAHIEVWRSVRSGGDTKTRKSRRTLALSALAVDVLRLHRLAQMERGFVGGIVFTSAVGTELDAANVRRGFRRALALVPGIEPKEWTPRELRHSFVSLLSASGIPLEDISRLVGHSGTHVTELVYRHELRPVIQTGAVAMDALFAAGDG